MEQSFSVILFMELSFWFNGETGLHIFLLVNTIIIAFGKGKKKNDRGNFS